MNISEFIKYIISIVTKLGFVRDEVYDVWKLNYNSVVYTIEINSKILIKCNEEILFHSYIKIMSNYDEQYLQVKDIFKILVRNKIIENII